MRKEQVFLVDIYQLVNSKREVSFNVGDCEAGYVTSEKILVEKDVPAIKFYNTYVPLKYMKNLREYLKLKLKDRDNISYFDSRYLDEWVHIYDSYNQKIEKNIRPVFNEKGFISFSKLTKNPALNQLEKTIYEQER